MQKVPLYKRQEMAISALKFYKYLVDWLVQNDIEQGGQRQKFPVTPNGSIYFYFQEAMDEDDRKSNDRESKGSLDLGSELFLEDQNAELEFALTEIFNYYSRKYVQKRPDFQSMQTELYNLNLTGFTAFCLNFQIPVDRAQIVLVYKKYSIKN